MARARRGSAEEEEEDEMEEMSMNEVRARVLAKGFTETQLMDTILEVSREWVGEGDGADGQYENMGVLMRMANGTRIRFVAPDEY
jgi:DNA replication licensing factor MCM7